MSVKAYIAAASFAFGTLGGGYVVHKVWWGKTQAAKVKTLTDANDTLAANVKAERALKSAAIQGQADLQDRLDKSHDRITQLEQSNAMLAASRAGTKTTIIKEGEALGKTLENDYAWVRFSWPDSLRDYANGDNGLDRLPATPALEGGPSNE